MKYTTRALRTTVTMAGAASAQSATSVPTKRILTAPALVDASNVGQTPVGVQRGAR